MSCMAAEAAAAAAAAAATAALVEAVRAFTTDQLGLEPFVPFDPILLIPPPHHIFPVALAAALAVLAARLKSRNTREMRRAHPGRPCCSRFGFLATGLAGFRHER